jgi:peptide/nickel transport system substrate-binding protein
MDPRGTTPTKATRLTRRTMLSSLLAVAVGAPLLQACQQAPAPPPAAPKAETKPVAPAPAAPASAPAAPASAPAAPTPAPPSAPAPAAVQPKRGGTINVGVQVDWITLDPVFGTANLGGAGMIFGHWIDWVKDEKTGQWSPVPEMATEWDLRPNEIILKLQKGIKFSDGTSWDARAAKWNLDRMIFDPASVMKASFAGVDLSREDPAALNRLKETAAQNFDFSSKAIETVDDSTVRIHLARPLAPLLTVLGPAIDFNRPVSPEAYQKAGKVAFGRNPVGAGPMRLVEWKTQSHITLERNPEYWKKAADGQPLPYADKLHVRWIADDSVRLLELKSGNIHFTERIQGKDIAGVKADSNLDLVMSEGSGTAYRMIFDSTNPESPFAKHKKLRQAMLYAIDREAMIKTLGFGAGYAAKYLIPKDAFGYSETAPFYWFDKARAEQLVKEVIAEDRSVAPNGKIPVALSIIDRVSDKAQAEMIKQMADSIGFDVSIDVLERAAWVAKLVKVPGKEGGKFDFSTMANNPVAIEDPDSQWRRYFHTEGSFNVAHLDSPAWNQRIDAAAATYDLEERKRLYAEIEKAAFDEAWYGYLWQQNYTWAMSKKLKDFREMAAAQWTLRDVWLG